MKNMLCDVINFVQVLMQSSHAMRTLELRYFEGEDTSSCKLYDVFEKHSGIYRKYVKLHF